jgi:hypothetical protein
MNDQQIALLQQAHSTWSKAEQQTDARSAYPLFQTAYGQFIAATKAGPPDADLLGNFARFCYFYTGFHSQKRRDYKEAEKVFIVGNGYADKALALDPDNFDARLFKVFGALDQLGDQPNFSSTLFDEKQGGFFGRLVKGGFEQGRFNSAKTSFLKALAALLDAYVEKSRGDAFVEDVVGMSEDLLMIVDICMEYSFDLSNVFETILQVDEGGLRYYSEEDKVEDLVRIYEEIKDVAASRLIAIQQG